MNNLGGLDGASIDSIYRRRQRLFSKISCLAVTGVFFASAQAQMVVGPGAVVELQTGSTIEMGCNNLVVQGQLTLSPNALITQADDLSVLESALLALGEGNIELAGDYNRSGSVTATGGGLARRDFGPECPAQQPIGPIPIDPTVIPQPGNLTPVPGLHGFSIGLLGLLMAWAYRRRMAPQVLRR